MRVLVTAVVVLAISVIGEAGATVVATERYQPVISPVLAGRTLEWGRWAGRDVALRALTLGGAVPPSTGQLLPGGGVWNGDASAQRVAFEQIYVLGQGGETVAARGPVGATWAGPPGAPVSPLGAGCVSALPAYERSVAVDSDLVAGFLDGCAPAVRDLGTDPGPGQQLPPDAYMPRVAWPYVAYLRKGGRGVGSVERIPLEVLDLRTGQVVFELSGRRMPGAVRALDVAADGTVLISYALVRSGSQRMRVAWASPAEPAVHALLGTAGYHVGQLGDGVAMILSRSLTARDGLGVLRLVRLDGVATTVARGVRTDSYRDSFHFDGARVTWTSIGCAAAQFHVGEVPALVRRPEGRPPRGCRLRVTGLGRTSPAHLRVSVSCAGFERGCVAIGTRLATARRPHRLVARSRVSLAGRIDARLTRLGRRLMAHGAPLRVVVSSEIGDFLGEGRNRRRATTFVLPAPK